MSRATRRCPAVINPPSTECRAPLVCSTTHLPPSEEAPDPYLAHEATCPSCGSRISWFTEDPEPHLTCTS